MIPDNFIRRSAKFIFVISYRVIYLYVLKTSRRSTSLIFICRELPSSDTRSVSSSSTKPGGKARLDTRPAIITADECLRKDRKKNSKCGIIYIVDVKRHILLLRFNKIRSYKFFFRKSQRREMIIYA